MSPADNLIRVEHKDGDLFEIDIRGHRVQVDQPVVDGGTDAAPTPTELFVASVASCVAFYTRRFLARHDLPAAGLAVTASFVMAERPARVGTIDIAISVPHGVPVDRRAAMVAVASHCTVENTLAQAPVVTVQVVA